MKAPNHIEFHLMLASEMWQVFRISKPYDNLNSYLAASIESSHLSNIGLKSNFSTNKCI